jgi:hypothetical protein
MAWLRTIARNGLGCGSDSDGQCVSEIAGAVASQNNPTITGQLNILWISETLRSVSTDFIEIRFVEPRDKIDAFRTALESTPRAAESELVRAARSASASVALLAEVQGRILMRGMGNDIQDNMMANLQISFHGALASVTEPGRRAARSLLDAADLLDQAEHEVDLATEGLSVPSGHVLIHTPTP